MKLVLAAAFGSCLTTTSAAGQEPSSPQRQRDPIPSNDSVHLIRQVIGPTDPTQTEESPRPFYAAVTASELVLGQAAFRIVWLPPHPSAVTGPKAAAGIDILRLIYKVAESRRERRIRKVRERIQAELRALETP